MACPDESSTSFIDKSRTCHEEVASGACRAIGSIKSLRISRVIYGRSDVSIHKDCRIATVTRSIFVSGGNKCNKFP